MRKLIITLSLVVAGCYSPALENPGFYCHASDNPACPDGQSCVSGRCVVPGTSVPLVDLATSHDLGAEDLASQPVDLAKTPVDLAKTPVDLAPSCRPQGGDCNHHNNAICCSGYCIYSSETCM